MMRSLKHSRGAALLVAMLVAALVAVIATKVGSHYILSFRRSANMLLGDQGYLFLLSAEALAKNVLIADEEPASDHLGEAWAQQVEPYVIDGGLLTGRIYDLQARFNLNNLLATPASSATPRSPGSTYTAEQKVFIRLLRSFAEEQEIEVSVQQAWEITDAVIDWLDANSEPTGFSSAEDDYYADLDIPYRAANRPMLSASELRLVKGMTAELYRALLPHITALPSTTKININTATANVLRSLQSAQSGDEYEPQSVADIQPVLEQREQDMQLGENAGGTVEQPRSGTTGRGGGDDPTGSTTGQTSNYFLFEGLVKLGDLSVPIRSVLNRSRSAGTPGAAQNQVRVIRRSLGSL